MDLYSIIQQAAHQGAYGHGAIKLPSAGQAKAGNYRKGRVSYKGMPLVIEQPQGSYREGVAPDGTRWRNRMAAHYGYIRSTKGADGDEVDVFVGPMPEVDQVYVINQINSASGNFDEHKVCLGFAGAAMAKTAYEASYDADWKGLGSMVPCTIDQLRAWLKYGNTMVPVTESDFKKGDGMSATKWDADGNPVGTDWATLIYGLRQQDSDSLLLDSVTEDEILEDADRVIQLDAMVTVYAKLQRKMNQLQLVMNAAGKSVNLSSVALTITPGFRQRGTVNVAAIFELSDGQTITIFFHNPDMEPKRIKPNDDVISWKWMLNKKDVTILVAPEHGLDLNIRDVARRLMRLAGRNSTRFGQANVNRAARMSSIKQMQADVITRTERLAQLDQDVAALKVEVQKHSAAIAAAGTPDSQKPMTPGEYGKAAFSAGMMRAPSLDRSFILSMAGSQDERAGKMAEWFTGYDAAASLGAPAPDSPALLDMPEGDAQPAMMAGEAQVEHELSPDKPMPDMVTDGPGMPTMANPETVGAVMPEGELEPFREAGAHASDLEMLANAGGYGGALSSDAALFELRDVLDHIFQDRILRVRAALRSLGWDGVKFGPLSKDGWTLGLTDSRHMGAGKNIVQLAYTMTNPAVPAFSIYDDMTMLALGMAQLIDIRIAERAQDVQPEGGAEAPATILKKATKKESREAIDSSRWAINDLFGHTKEEFKRRDVPQVLNQHIEHLEGLQTRGVHPDHQELIAGNIDSMRRMIERWEGVQPAAAELAPDNESASEQEGRLALSKIRQYMPKSQISAVLSGMKDEEKQYFFDKMVELETLISGMPITYEQEDKGLEAIAYLHYFYAGSNWYITEKDMEGDGTLQAFGIASLNGGDPEYGYISINELVSHNIELDFGFKPTTLGKLNPDAQTPDNGEEAGAGENEDASRIATVDALYLFENASLAFKDWLADSVDLTEYSPFVTCMSADKGVAAYADRYPGIHVEWALNPEAIGGVDNVVGIITVGDAQLGRVQVYPDGKGMVYFGMEGPNRVKDVAGDDYLISSDWGQSDRIDALFRMITGNTTQMAADAEAAEQAAADAAALASELEAKLRERLLKNKFRKGSVEIATNAGMKPVQSLVYGGLAVHRTPKGSGKGAFTVSHVGTGLAIMTGFDSQEDAKLAASRLAMDSDFLQPFKRGDDAKAFFETALAVATVIRDAGYDPLAQPDIDIEKTINRTIAPAQEVDKTALAVAQTIPVPAAGGESEPELASGVVLDDIGGGDDDTKNFLQSVIDRTVDMTDAMVAERLTAVSEGDLNEPELKAMFDKANQSYASYLQEHSSTVAA